MKWIFDAFGGRLMYRGKEEEIRVRKWRTEYGRRVVRPSIEQVRARVSERETGYPEGEDSGE
jgi:hypothetical protein